MVKILELQCGYYEVKTLQHAIKIIMDVNVTLLTKNNNEIVGKLVQVLCGEKTTKYIMKYS